MIEKTIHVKLYKMFINIIYFNSENYYVFEKCLEFRVMIMNRIYNEYYNILYIGC